MQHLKTIRLHPLKFAHIRKNILQIFKRFPYFKQGSEYLVVSIELDEKWRTTLLLCIHTSNISRRSDVHRRTAIIRNRKSFSPLQVFFCWKLYVYGLLYVLHLLSKLFFSSSQQCHCYHS